VGTDDSFDSLTEQEENSTSLSYLNGKGDLLWRPNGPTSSLFPKLVQFRDINITGAKSNKILNDIRAL
jgi:hypothetical protein